MWPYNIVPHLLKADVAVVAHFLRLVATGFQIRTHMAKKTLHASSIHLVPFFSSSILGYLIKQTPDKTPADLFTPSWMTILRTIDGQKHIYHNITVLPRWSNMEVVYLKNTFFSFLHSALCKYFLFRFYVLIWMKFSPSIKCWIIFDKSI